MAQHVRELFIHGAAVNGGTAAAGGLLDAVRRKKNKKSS